MASVWNGHPARSEQAIVWLNSLLIRVDKNTDKNIECGTIFFTEFIRKVLCYHDHFDTIYRACPASADKRSPDMFEYS